MLQFFFRFFVGKTFFFFCFIQAWNASASRMVQSVKILMSILELSFRFVIPLIVDNCAVAFFCFSPLRIIYLILLGVRYMICISISFWKFMDNWQFQYFDYWSFLLLSCGGDFNFLCLLFHFGSYFSLYKKIIFTKLKTKMFKQNKVWSVIFEGGLYRSTPKWFVECKGGHVRIWFKFTNAGASLRLSLKRTFKFWLFSIWLIVAVPSSCDHEIFLCSGLKNRLWLYGTYRNLQFSRCWRGWDGDY